MLGFRWIPITEQPPPRGRSILVWCVMPGGSEYWTHAHWGTTLEFGCEGFSPSGTTVVTHWSEIPDPEFPEDRSGIMVAAREFMDEAVREEEAWEAGADDRMRQAGIDVDAIHEQYAEKEANDG